MAFAFRAHAPNTNIDENSHGEYDAQGLANQGSGEADTAADPEEQKEKQEQELRAKEKQPLIIDDNEINEVDRLSIEAYT